MSWETEEKVQKTICPNFVSITFALIFPLLKERLCYRKWVFDSYSHFFALSLSRSFVFALTRSLTHFLLFSLLSLSTMSFAIAMKVSHPKKNLWARKFWKLILMIFVVIIFFGFCIKNLSLSLLLSVSHSLSDNRISNDTHMMLKPLHQSIYPSTSHMCI